MTDFRSEPVPNLTVSVTGLGYVGLPAALAFASRYHVIGYDHSAVRIAMLQERKDPSGAIAPEAFTNANVEFSASPDAITKANFHIVATPTPVDSNKAPDLSLLKDAMHTIGKRLKRGDAVVIESTVYPGCVEDDLLPILEDESGLHADSDFHLGYSPERINPG